MNDQPYLIPAASVRFEEEIKKSTFITFLAHTPSIDSAKHKIEEIKKQHPNARHHCWAFIAGRAENSLLWGFSDDGEPSGTAGKPILAQLSGSGVGEITAVVVRYFGGVKLGTGGLVKAYGGGVQQALTLLTTIEKKVMVNLMLTLDYEQIALAQAIMAQFEAIEVQASYTHQVQWQITLERRYSDSFCESIINKSSARIQITPMNTL